MEYINSLPLEHLLFTFHWCRKVEQDQLHQLGRYLGVLWSREELEKLSRTAPGAPGERSSIFVPLSLVINPDLVEGLTKNQGGTVRSADGMERPLPRGDGLNTEMPMPVGEDVVNMAELSKEDFLGVIKGSGLPTRTKR